MRDLPLTVAMYFASILGGLLAWFIGAASWSVSAGPTSIHTPLRMLAALALVFVAGLAFSHRCMAAVANWALILTMIGLSIHQAHVLNESLKLAALWGALLPFSPAMVCSALGLWFDEERKLGLVAQSVLIALPGMIALLLASSLLDHALA